MNYERGKVLILVSDRSIVENVSTIAGHLGLDAMCVKEPAIFFEAVSQWNPSHIVVDLEMQELDVMSILQQLGESGCMARIAISCGLDDRILSAATRSASEHGLCVTYLMHKPIRTFAMKSFLGSGRCLLPPRVAITEPRPVDGAAAVTPDSINEAIERDQIRLVYQPKVACASGQVIGFETLVRWEHPTLGLVMPDQFIPLSERTGLIRPLTDRIVQLALEWYWETIRNSGLSLSINLSAQSLCDHDLAASLAKECRNAGVAEEKLIFEITETAAMEDQLSALDTFTRLRIRGFNVSIDDYGVGNSSLKLLANLPFSEVKIDKSFAMSAATSEESRVIIKSTVDLCRNLGLSVVTEGVEDPQTLGYLHEIKCDYAQGYFIARPMAGDQVQAWMLNRRSETTRSRIIA